MTFPWTRLALGAFATVAATAAAAHDYRIGTLSIGHPWARETTSAQTVGGGFLSIANRGAREDRLISATSPAAAQAQLHTMTMDGGVMRMREVADGIAIPARQTVSLQPGGLHIMFMGLKRQLRPGERFPVTLRFQRAGRVTVQFAVQAIGATSPAEGGHAGH